MIYRAEQCCSDLPDNQQFYIVNETKKGIFLKAEDAFFACLSTNPVI